MPRPAMTITGMMTMITRVIRAMTITGMMTMITGIIRAMTTTGTGMGMDTATATAGMITPTTYGVSASAP